MKNELLVAIVIKNMYVLELDLLDCIISAVDPADISFPPFLH